MAHAYRRSGERRRRHVCWRVAAGGVALDLIGVLANAVLGGVIARSARLDVVGFATLAILSGLGGGIIRDTLLQHGPPVALTDYSYILTALAARRSLSWSRSEGPVWDRPGR